MKFIGLTENLILSEIILRLYAKPTNEVYLVKEYGGTYIGGMPAIYLKGIREGYAWTEHEEILGNIYENPELLEVED